MINKKITIELIHYRTGKSVVQSVCSTTMEECMSKVTELRQDNPQYFVCLYNEEKKLLEVFYPLKLKLDLLLISRASWSMEKLLPYWFGNPETAGIFMKLSGYIMRLKDGERIFMESEVPDRVGELFHDLGQQRSKSE
jgi:hypothetical protein